MAAAADPNEVLRSTSEKANFHRVTRLLISGGTRLLRESFDSIHPPSYLYRVLTNPIIEKQLKSARLSKPQWDCLYPSPGVYGKSSDFDLTLLFRLLRTICNLTPPALGWDALPAITDHSLTADLARIKYYRNSIYGHVNQNMEITDDEFPALWQAISDALARIAGCIGHTTKIEWQKAIDSFLKDPLTAEDERNVQELRKWYENDTEVKKSMEELKNATQEGMEHLERCLKGVHEELEERAHGIAKSVKCFERVAQEEAQLLRDQLGCDLETATQGVQEGMERLETCLKGVHGGLERKTHLVETAVREEAQDIKDQLGAVHQSIARLNSSAGGSQQATGARLRLRINCDSLVSEPGLQVGSYEVAVASQEHQGEAQLGATGIPITSCQQQTPAPGGFGGENFGNGVIPSAQGVLNFIAFKYFQAVDPSKPEELNGYLQYLKDVRKVLFVDAQSGSLIVTVECSSLEILEGLWNDYCAGRLNEMAQKFLVTEDVLKKFGLTEVKLTTTIL